MGTVYVIATPIGNLEDITLRAIRLLGEADLVLAEDTRRVRILLDRHAIAAKPISLNAHNEARRIERVLEALEGDRCVALVSDAGTPVISDPGDRLIRAAIDAGHRIESIPGASAVLSALVVSGLESGPFVFLGFLPRKKGQREKLLTSYRDRAETLVIFESPRRVRTSLEDLAAVLGERKACIARELTKMHEEVVRGTLQELADGLPESPRGEFTLVVEGCGEGDRAKNADPEAVDEAIRALLESGGRPREISAELAERTGLPKRELYARAVALRGDR